MSDDPEIFREALKRFSDAVFEKAVARAKEHDRPMDPWREYEPEFIRGRLIMEIGEFLEKFLIFDNEEGRSPEDEEAENSELYDIAALACSLWMAHQVGNK